MKTTCRPLTTDFLFILKKYERLSSWCRCEFKYYFTNILLLYYNNIPWIVVHLKLMCINKYTTRFCTQVKVFRWTHFRLNICQCLFQKKFHVYLYIRDFGVRQKLCFLIVRKLSERKIKWIQATNFSSGLTFDIWFEVGWYA